jgi:hypothetical protein
MSAILYFFYVYGPVILFFAVLAAVLVFVFADPRTQRALEQGQAPDGKGGTPVAGPNDRPPRSSDTLRNGSAQRPPTDRHPAARVRPGRDRHAAHRAVAPPAVLRHQAANAK